jgi:hypothetical protein
MSYTKCLICNRPLKNPASRELGMGKVCASKGKGGASVQNKVSDNDNIEPYNGKDIYIRREPGGIIFTNVQRSEYKHSPTGFNFGYGGSGVSDFALNCLLMFVGKEEAHSWYQDFKWEFCANKDTGDELIIKRKDILTFIKQKRRNK